MSPLPPGGHSVSQRARIRISYTVTEDMPDGQPWPPSVGTWAIVRRTHGFTRWRCITLQSKQSGAVTLGGGLANSAASEGSN
jgi:hypothetical protein